MTIKKEDIYGQNYNLSQFTAWNCGASEETSILLVGLMNAFPLEESQKE